MKKNRMLKSLLEMCDCDNCEIVGVDLDSGIAIVKYKGSDETMEALYVQRVGEWVL